VADFENKTGDSVFDGALEQALGLGLEGASFINVNRRTDAQKVAAKMDPEFDGHLDSNTAQLVCVREGISLLIDGSIEKKGNNFVITAWAKDPLHPENVSKFESKAASKEEVLNATASLANKLRKDLGDLAADSSKAFAVETFSTNSIQAMRAYTQAQVLYGQGKIEEAIAAYFRAIEEDPNLGRAYTGLALAYRNRGEMEQAEKYFQEAFSHLDHMSEREKLRSLGIYHLYNGNFQKAIEENTKLIEKYPADFAGSTNLALSYFFAHRYAETLEYGRRATELAPNNIIPQFNMCWYSLAASQFDLVDAEIDKALVINSDYDEVYVVQALSQLAREQNEQAMATYEKMKPLSPTAGSLAALGLADVALYEGRVADAIDILEKRISFDQRTERKDYMADKWIALARAYHAQENREHAQDAVGQAVAISDDRSILVPAARIYISEGKMEQARRLAELLSKRPETEPRTYVKLIEGEIKLAEKYPADAVVIFLEAQAMLDTWLGRLLLGRAYLELGSYPEAHAEFEACLKRRGEATSIFFNDTATYHYFPPVYYYLGRAKEGLGSPAAKGSYQKFLDMQSQADAGSPLIADAQNRLGVL
jgi:tetratricopeptide (TPR) repeat protein